MTSASIMGISLWLYTLLPSNALIRPLKGPAKPLKLGSKRMFAVPVLRRKEECPNQTTVGLSNVVLTRSVFTAMRGLEGSTLAGLPEKSFNKLNHMGLLR